MLAHGRDLHKGERPVGLSISRCRPVREDAGLHAFGAPEQAGSDKFHRPGDEGEQPPTQDGHRQERGKHRRNHGHQPDIEALRMPHLIEMVRIKYLNNLVEQDHRLVKRRVRPILRVKSFQAEASNIAGIELVIMIRKG